MIEEGLKFEITQTGKACYIRPVIYKQPLLIRFNLSTCVLRSVRYNVRMNKNTISISQARSKLFTIAQRVQTPGVYFTFTDKGRPKTVIMSADEYESIIETLEVLRDFPDLDRTIAKVDKDVKSGAYLNYPTLDDILAKEGYILNNKLNTKHGVSATRRTKRAKKS
ncbi:MAG: type II toxin-antitoxin system Phd/YefM family antitoxin [Candidatus Yanofskybacteria bacterium]|nr:type II toxin-antitoxin system Phd/YefM family antitoxin [Candidatus Yanofskybacteria bacterium]